jgi:hypothetical protein
MIVMVVPRHGDLVDALGHSYLCFLYLGADNGVFQMKEGSFGEGVDWIRWQSLIIFVAGFPFQAG